MIRNEPSPPPLCSTCRWANGDGSGPYDHCENPAAVASPVYPSAVQCTGWLKARMSAGHPDLGLSSFQTPSDPACFDDDEGAR